MSRFASHWAQDRPELVEDLRLAGLLALLIAQAAAVGACLWAIDGVF